MTTEIEQRASVIAEAKTWLNTPFAHQQQKKGAGCDCVGFLLGVYSAVGLIKPFTPEYYPPDWFIHRDTERYLDGMLQYTKLVDKPKKGDVAMYKFGRAFSHAIIAIDWPFGIHAFVGRGVAYVNVIQNSVFWKREVKFVTLW
jgi:NlpC/P60 family putative phage cell wall peptidase